MKVILTQDFDKLGANGTVVDVAEGYARNFLLPNQIAVQASGSVLRHYDERKKAVAKKEATILEKAQQAGADLEALTVTLKEKVGSEGKLYGAVTNKEVAHALAEQHKIELDKKQIEIKEPIRTVGEHTVSVKIHSKVTVALKVLVEQLEG